MDSLPITGKTKNMLVAVIAGMLTIITAVIASISFQFTLVGNLVMSWILTTAYAIFAMFLINPAIRVDHEKIVEKPVIQIQERVVERPVFHEIQMPMENRVIEVVDRPVIKEVPYPVEIEKRVIKYVERKHRKLNIPKFNFIGSTESRTFHKRTCRFSKLIKKKYKNHSNTKIFFKKKHYHACESCIKKK